MKAAIVFLALVLAASAVNLREQEFQQWKKKFNKSYETLDEHNLRMKIFSANLEYIESVNAKAKNPEDLRLAANQFADMTNMEYKMTVLSLTPAPRYATSTHKVSLARPDSIDWRTDGLVSPPKNQGSCGSCWAFSAVGAMEGAYAKAHGNLVTFSEQQLVDCSGAFGNDGCNGGLMSQAMDYILQYGAMTEDDYKYTGKNGQCKYKPDHVYKFTSYVNITEGSEDALQDAIGNIEPVAVAIDASHMSFQFYSSGVYNEKNCKNKEDDLDHGVMAVGYDKTSKGDEYYIVKNSWGASWGQKGYIWMSRNKNNQCGIATCAEYPIAA